MTAGSAPRVSVIMIFLNGEPFLDEAIASVLAQSFGDLELLLVDDGSAAAATAIARNHAAQAPERVRYFEHPGHANRGMSATRNLGLRHARGELVAFIDADDVWEPHKLAEQVAILDGHPTVAMVCGSVRYWSSWCGGDDRLVPTGHVANRIVLPPEAALALYPLGTAAAPCPSDLMMRRSVVEALGGFEEQFTGALQMYEDQAFLAKLYLAAPVYFSDRVWLRYRQHDQSCVAEVTRSGRYGEVRRTFLEWLERRLPGLPDETRHAVAPAIGRALRPFRYPRLHAALTWLRRLRRAPGKIAIRLHAAVP